VLGRALFRPFLCIDGRAGFGQAADPRWPREGVAAFSLRAAGAGSDAGLDTAAVVPALTGTVKLNGLSAEAYLHGVLERIAGHLVNFVGALLPYNFHNHMSQG